MKTFSEFGIDVRGATEGEIKTLCPECSKTRKKQHYPCLNVNVGEGVWNCWHCGWTGTLKRGAEPLNIPRRKEYRKPPATPPGISENWAAWLIRRGISRKTIERNGIKSGAAYFPQISREADSIIFPFRRAGEVINCKYRDIEKNFRMAGGAERLLYGLDDIITEGLIWVEGEIDKLSIEEAGYLSCVSVPDGAPAVTAKNYATKFEFMDSAADALASVEKHFLAVDNDPPGQRLQDELLRRLGAEKCWIVRWPEGCKDANEVLQRHGKQAIVDAIDAAKPAPIEGIIAVSDCVESLEARYESGPRRGISTGWAVMDYYYTVREGEWTVITGIPGHGKSEWLDALMVNIAATHGWRFAVCSPENQPIEEHIQKLAEKFVGRPFYETPAAVRMSRAEMQHAREWIDDHFTFILPEEPRLDCVLDLAKALVRRNGINGLVIDPWNEIEYSREPGMSETEHISKCLTKIRRFARTHQIHLWVVAHPTKMQKEKDSNKYMPPTLYDISGSAHWRNKADNGITVYRDQTPNSNKVQIMIGKVRFKIVGRVGSTDLRYDYLTGRYVE